MKGLWLLLFALVTASSALAQQGITPIRTNLEALQNLSAAAGRDYKVNRARAIELANRNGWVIEKTYKDGTHMSLQGLDAKGLPIYYITYNNTRAAATTKTDQLWSGGGLGLNLSGANSSVSSKLGVWDAGRVLETHQELRGRVVQKDNANTADDHATHVAGTLVASGVNGFAKGMAFGVRQLQAYDYNNDVSEMAAAANNLLVSNHSYGSIAGWRYNSDRKGTKGDPFWEWWGDAEISDTVDYKFGYYSDVATSWDRISYNAPYYLIVKSAGNNRNDNGPAVGEPYYKRSRNGNFTLEASRPANISNNNGYDNIPTYGTAKNILTVGAVAPIPNGYNKPADVAVSAFSSFGPTDDGRIKPDIVGNGVAVLSTSSTSDFAYRSSNGTSMASPNVAGTLLLLQEHYANLNNGAAMRSATLKGLAIHTADEAGPAPGPDYRHGWGLLNADKAASVISNTNQAHLLQERSLNQSQTYTFQVVASGYGPLVATICWTDPEATATPIGREALNNRTPRLVNDLDLRVSGLGTTHLPWTLNPLNPAQAASPGDNTLDNVEQITIANAVPGETYTIRVSHKGTLRNSRQDYSLLVSGIGGKAYCTSAPSSDAGARLNSISLGSHTLTMPAGCSTTRNYTAAAPIFFEPGQTQVFTLNTGFCGTEAPTAAKAFFDWNNNGSFTDAGEEATFVTGTSNTLTAAVTAPGTVVAGNKVRMRLVLQETENSSSISACGSYSRGETQDYVVQLIRQQNDVGITNISIPGGTLCATPSQALVIRLRNFGEAAQTNIPVSVRVLQNGMEVATLTGVYNRTLAPFSEEEMLLESTFSTEAGTTYELVATSALETDVVASNNRLARTITISTPAAPPQASAVRCGTSSQYTLNSSGGSSTYWYASPDAAMPVAAGHQLSADLGLVGSSLYVALNDFAATVGPPTKSFATGGGYNQFTPDVLVTTNAPMLLESARLYIGHSGRITFTAFNADGAPVSSRTLNVVATRTTPGTGVQPDDPADAGAVYYLGLALPEAGNYRIGIAYEGGATIYRNNEGVEGYPFGLPNVFSITGSSANPGPLSYYYYFYDLKIKALGCQSERVLADITTGASVPQPVVTRLDSTLVSSAPTGNRWYLNGRLLVGATGNTYIPQETGSYSVSVLGDGCISEMSVPYTYIYRPDVPELGPELLVSPNPSTGRFRLELETAQAEDITFEVTDMVGHLLYTGKVEQRNGQFEGFVDLSGKASGVYLLRVQHGSRHYSRKLVVQR
ncbi:S8 family serine peptidase [Pontibacter qinzhouensis]|uniref:S8 family serine peptidase n=1 Tax=Pontibacter qinzhouensis TaxID=2603253 RepID=A0A5C8KDJ2_9BACT|nr:S8 family serine peptidase [Pontibacter qinzhouensis]TXK52795.1 S8 family serine peptidase [Pontibacter qinzhouensis]